jgi:5-oxoprolinase (ATP-hydrolysing)
VPGPACYGLNGPLTITDANLLLGKLHSEFFPHCFGPKRNQPLAINPVKTLFEQLTQTINEHQSEHFNSYQIAQGFIEIAVEAMAQAIKEITFAKGHNIENQALLCFGGAGGQHACLIAEKLGLKKVMLPPKASVFSALGMGLADISKTVRQSYHHGLTLEALKEINSIFKTLESKNTLEQLPGFAHQLEYQQTLQLAYQNSQTLIDIEYDTDIHKIIKQFSEKHLALFGFFDKDQGIEIRAVVLKAKRKATPFTMTTNKPTSTELSSKTIHLYTKGQPHQASCYDALALPTGKKINGPAVILFPETSFVVEPGWQCYFDEDNVLYAETNKIEKPYYGLTQRQPILLEIFNQSFMHIANQMGQVLSKTALSVNIKERRDYSCAIFNTQGQLIANAPHMPVHLGSMAESVKAIINQFESSLKEGDAYIVNSPYQGGTHLPDITIISPVFIDGHCLFYVGSRGHHADIGGISPGSLPAFSHHIAQEGVLIEPQPLIKDNQFLKTQMVALFKQSKARNIPQNLSDLKAQCAANHKGKQALVELCQAYSSQTVMAYMNHIQENATEAVTDINQQLKTGSFNYLMDDNKKIHVNVKKENDKVLIDFSGSSAEQDNNFNAPIAVTKAAVIYVLRTLVKRNIPLNEGLLKNIKLIIPKPSILNPNPPHAVVAGNVETSQAVVNALYLALGEMAASQGTMNNLSFGNAQYQYYETLCGGTGAGPTFHGLDAIHSHMTNSLLTDLEVFENRYPVQVIQFTIRHHSGGEGEYSGGNGLIREFLFNDTFEVNMISGHRQTTPPGLNGGKDGKVGKNFLVTTEKGKQSLPGCFKLQVKPGDRLIVKTPGGGGYGLH